MSKKNAKTLDKKDQLKDLAIEKHHAVGFYSSPYKDNSAEMARKFFNNGLPEDEVDRLRKLLDQSNDLILSIIETLEGETGTSNRKIETVLSLIDQYNKVGEDQ